MMAISISARSRRRQHGAARKTAARKTAPPELRPCCYDPPPHNVVCGCGPRHANQ